MLAEHVTHPLRRGWEVLTVAHGAGAGHGALRLQLQQVGCLLVTRAGGRGFGLLQSAQLRNRRAGWALISPFSEAQCIPLAWLLNEFPHSAPSWLTPQTPVSVAGLLGV